MLSSRSQIGLWLIRLGERILGVSRLAIEIYCGCILVLGLLYLTSFPWYVFKTVPFRLL